MVSLSWRQLVPFVGLAVFLIYFASMLGTDMWAHRSETQEITVVLPDEIQRIGFNEAQLGLLRGMIDDAVELQLARVRADTDRIVRDELQAASKKQTDALTSGLRQVANELSRIQSEKPSLQPLHIHLPDEAVTVVPGRNDAPSTVVPASIPVPATGGLPDAALNQPHANQPQHSEAHFDPEALPSGWVEYTNADGRKYFVNDELHVSTWARPPALKREYAQWLATLEEEAFVAAEDETPTVALRWVQRFARFQNMMLMQHQWTKRLVIVKIQVGTFEETMYSLVNGVMFAIATERAVLLDAEDAIWWNWLDSPINVRYKPEYIGDGNIRQLQGFGERGMRSLKNEWMTRDLSVVYPEDVVVMSEFTAPFFSYIVNNPNHRRTFQSYGLLDKELPTFTLDAISPRYTCSAYDELIGRIWSGAVVPSAALQEKLDTFAKERSLTSPYLGLYSRVDGPVRLTDASDWFIECAAPYLHQNPDAKLYMLADRANALRDALTAFPERVETQLPTRLNRDWGVRPHLIDRNTAENVFFDHFMLAKADALITAPDELGRSAARAQGFCPHIAPSSEAGHKPPSDEYTFGTPCSSRLLFPRYRRPS